MAIFQFVLGVDVAADNFIFNGHRYNYYTNSAMLIGPIMDRFENIAIVRQFMIYALWYYDGHTIV